MNQQSQFTHLAENSLDCVHARHGRTNLHRRPYVAHKTFSRQIQTAYHRTVSLQKRHTIPTYRTRTITKKAYRR